MRVHYLCLLLAACGDNFAGERFDAAPDSMADGPQPVASRVWILGELLVDQEDMAGGFTHGMGTLPFGPGNEPPIRIANVAAFDARGAKIAYVSDSTVAARFDLHVANADNTNPIVVIRGGVANVEISSVSLSPDGTRV